jgi:L-lactate dehydrogenase complex protein LldG
MADRSRERILSAIRRARGGDDAARQAAVEARLARPEPGPVPARTRVEPGARRALFVSMAEESGATVDRVAGSAAVPHAVARYLAGANLPARLSLAPDPELARLPWDAEPLLSVTAARDGREAGETALVEAFSGIAETGTLVLLSGPASPTSLNLLPDTHIVLLRESRLHGAYEEVWPRLRAAGMPRTVNFVTGPSRSADIEQTLLMGAHGPRRLHIILVDDAA